MPKSIKSQSNSQATASVSESLVTPTSTTSTSKVPSIIFGLIMSYSMAVGMEIYNIAIKHGVNLQNGGFSNLQLSIIPEVLLEISYMGLIVFAISSLFGNKLGAALSKTHCNPTTDNPYICQLLRQASTVSIMCPAMSLVATLLFAIIPGHAPLLSLPAIWFGTILKNFPMAFFWNMFAAAPFTHRIISALPSRKPTAA